MRRRNILLAVGLSTVLSVCAAEIGLRLFAPRRTYEVLTAAYPAMFDVSDVMPYRLRSGYTGRLSNLGFDPTIPNNSLGHRGTEFTESKSDKRRVLVIGDSFTFGWGVNDNETYPALLQEYLEARSSAAVEVINAGFAAGYSPDTYYLYLKNEGLRLEPDAIVVGLFVGNDLDSDAAFENEWLTTDAQGLPLSIRNQHSRVVDHYLVPWPIPVRYRTPILSRLHVYQGLFDIWWELSPRLRAWLPTGTTLYAQSPSGAADDNVPYNYRLRFADRTNTVYARVKGLLAAMHKLATASGVPIYFMVIPESVQLQPGAYLGLAADMARPQKELAAFFGASNMTHLDLLPFLRERAAGSVLYFPNDGHFTVDGNRLAAERLGEFLQREWLQP